jgi:hypothetical protein
VASGHPASEDGLNAHGLWLYQPLVEGGHPASEDGLKAHGLHDFINPWQANSLRGMKEIKAKKETRGRRSLMTVQEFSCRKDGGWPIKN